MATLSKYTTLSAAGTEVPTRAERHMSTKGGTYREAIRAVLAADKQASDRTPAVPVPAPAAMAQGKTPGETVHLGTVALMDLVPHLDYQSAVNQVLAADADLKIAYARS